MRRLITAIVLLAAMPLLAETRYQISKIEFHSRIPSNILLTQSALSEDRTYSDAELALAVARLRRLPFVYNAKYTVDGSTLVIDVLDETRVFAHFDAFVQGDNTFHSGNGVLDSEVGARYALKWGGVVEGSVGLLSGSGSSEHSWTASYQQYGVAGTRTFAAFTAIRSGSAGSTSPHLLIGYPLSLRQTVSISASRLTYADNENSGIGGHFSSSAKLKTITGQWRWDTTNDPLFATRGTALSVAQGISRDTNFAQSVTGTGTIVFTNDSRGSTSSTVLSAAKFWPIGRGAFTADVNGEFERGHIDSRRSLNTDFVRSTRNFRTTSANIGWVYNFFSSPTSDHRNRIETAVGLVDNHQTIGLHSISERYRNAQLGYAMRQRWGMVHLVLSYLSK